jgi:hypothetical protein
VTNNELDVDGIGLELPARTEISLFSTSSELILGPIQLLTQQILEIIPWSDAAKA